MSKYPLLDIINHPRDLKKLTPAELPQLAGEMRHYILEVVSEKGGHLGAALGCVELAIALHYLLDSPNDSIVWDVGHQVHAHKILTGRREAFKTFRDFRGISGLSNSSESVHDVFTTGHGGTSISTSLGISVGKRLMFNQKDKTVAVIGDASLVSGMAFEALNHAGQLKRDIIVILNDNEMSISPSVGALSRHLNHILTNPFYNRVRKDIEGLLRRLPRVGTRLVKKAKQIEEGLLHLLVPGLIFEELGFRYFGPVDGHDLKELLRMMKSILEMKGPILLHVITQKGKGYAIAEKDPRKWHAQPPFDLATGKPRKTSEAVTYTQAFGRKMLTLAEANPRVCALTAGMCDGTGLDSFSKKFPERFFDVGIAEEHGVAFCAGLAKAGLRPVVAIYSTFLQRSHDQIIHDVALQNLSVIFALDRAGLVGEDGPTHHGVFDIVYLRKIPNMTLMAPKDGEELEAMLELAVNHTEGPIAVRYPRGAVPNLFSAHLSGPLIKGKAQIIRQGEEVALVAVGSMVAQAFLAAEQLIKEGINAAVVNARFIKPLDEMMLTEFFKTFRLIVTLEEGSRLGGFGSAVLELAESKGFLGGANGLPSPRIRCLGIPDRFIEHGKRETLFELCGLSETQIVQTVIKELETLKHYA